jgi:outer membrane protein OmpA-like peptidoglycan-associated protein
LWMILCVLCNDTRLSPLMKCVRMNIRSACVTVLAFSLVACGSLNSDDTGEYASSVGYKYKSASVTSKAVIVGAATGAVVGGVSDAGIPVGAAVGAVVGGALGSFLQQRMTLVQALEKRGVKIIRLGDDVRIIFPSAALFKGNSANFRSSSYKVLDMVAQFLSGMTKISIEVGAYYPSAEHTAVNQRLTEHQAQAVEAYLWRQGSDARMMVVVGYGGGHLVKKGTFAVTKADLNYRVEITLRDLSLDQRGD